jgi:hypothetical protein
MAEVVLPVAVLPALRPPPICARTGRPARGTRDVTMIRTPIWAWGFLLLGCLLGLVVIWVISPRVTIALPIAPDTRRRRAVALAAMVATFVLFLASIFSLGVLSEAVCASGALVSAVLYAIAQRTFARSWVGGTWFEEAHVRIKRLDPTMAEILTAQAAGLAVAGWHPDPGGTHRLRWYDGRAWTEHVHD